MTPQRIRIPEAVIQLGVPINSVRTRAKNGQLPGAVKIGKFWTFDLKNKIADFITE